MLLRLINVLFYIVCFIISTFAGATENNLTPEQLKEWLPQALEYGFNQNTTDYTKYMSEQYVEEIDGQTFDFQQWVHHMNTLKGMMKSYSLHFNSIVAEGNKIASSYEVLATKKDGTKLNVRVIAIFTLQNGKMIHCDELTYLEGGPSADQHLSDHS